MINFLRIINNITLGSFLHTNGNIDEIPSSDIIGVCVIPSNFLPDRLARFMSLKEIDTIWGPKVTVDPNYRQSLPGKYHKWINWGYLDTDDETKITSPYLSNESFNPEFFKRLYGGNVFRDYKGYENARKYRKNYGNKRMNSIFTCCSKISPSYKNSEWYVPSISELAIMFEKKPIIHSKIKESLLANSPGKLISCFIHWSSSEWDFGNAWTLDIDKGHIDFYSKESHCFIRAFLAL